MNHTFQQKIIASALLATLSGCSGIEPKVTALKEKNQSEIAKYQEMAQQPIPVITYTETPWIMGAPVQLAEPTLPILKQHVAYHPTKMVSLADVASWVTQNTGLVVDIAELQTSTNGTGTETNGVSLGGSGNMPGVMPGANSGSTNGIGGVIQQSMWSMFVNYEGSLSGLLDVAANKSSAWWRVVDGRINFYRYESKTFYFPALSRKFTSDSTITSTSGSGTSSGGLNGTVSTGSLPSGGSTNVSSYLIDTWTDLEATAKIVGSGAQVVANRAAGSVTVTGTPAQVRNVEKWAKDLADQQSQQVAITMHVYSVQLNNEDNYNWNPTVVFKNVAGTYGFNITGPQAPAITSGTNPSKFNLSVLQSAIPGESSQYSGSQLAFQAISTMGEITESIHQTIVSLNGQPMPVQIADTEGYLAASESTITADVGSTSSLTPGSLTTGFTVLFTPKIVNGKVILGLDMQNSSNNGFGVVSSGGATIQTPNTSSNSSQQSVSLTPGEALLLTGIQKDNGSIRKSGVGKANNYLLGGGVGNDSGKQMIAIVISAKIL